MVRKSKSKQRPENCLICGDKSIGINFNVPSCMSCRAFFRRNAYREEEMKCAFSDSCKIDQITRKFCTKCRLTKCFQTGMKKEWILTEEEKQMYKEKIIRNRLRREQKEKLEKIDKKAKRRKKSRKSSTSVSECSMSSRSSSTSSSSSSSSTSEDPSSPDGFFVPNFALVQKSKTPETRSYQHQQHYPLLSAPSAAVAAVNLELYSTHQSSDKTRHAFLGYVDPMMTGMAASPPPPQETIDPSLLPMLTDNSIGFDGGFFFNNIDDDDPLNMMDDMLNYVTAEEHCHPFGDSDDFLFTSVTTTASTDQPWSIVDLDTNQTKVVNQGNLSSLKNSKFLTPILPEITNSSSNNADYFLTSLTSSNVSEEEPCSEDPLVESLHYQINPLETDDAMFREIGFPTRELILPEKCLIRELSSACAVLQNPYHQIRDISSQKKLKLQTDDLLLTQHYFFRMIRMAKGLGSFSTFSTNDQAMMLKQRLLEMVAIRSALFYHPDRESWCFIDDKSKASVMVPMSTIQPYCRLEFSRHAKFPDLFREEWKRDNIIFDLLTTIILFSPGDDYANKDKMKEEHLRYTRLLSRYLEIKYNTFTEAETCFKTLMGTVEEMRLLISDIRRFFRSSNISRESPLFTEIFDLTTDSVPAITNE